MGENAGTFTIAGSRGTTVYATGHVGGVIRIRDAARPGVVLAEVPTAYDLGLHRLAVSGEGGRLAVGAYHGGLELWHWRDKHLVWATQTVRNVQSVSFSEDGQNLYVASDSHGLVAIDCKDGRILNRFGTLRDPVGSPFGDLLFATSEGQHVVIDRRSHKRVLAADRRSFGVLAACFTPQAVIVSEADGWLRAFALTDGREMFAAVRTRWSAFMQLAAVNGREEVIAWASVGAKVEEGELVRVVMPTGQLLPLASRSWQHAAPLLSGTLWVFADGTTERT